MGEEETLVRLDRLLAEAGLCSRSGARSKIREGLVTVDGRTVRRPESKVSRLAPVFLAGERVDTARFVYYMMNKPSQTICATRDGAWPAVTGLLPEKLQRRGLFPVGRLDADVTGLLLLTDDGAFAHRVTSPRSGVLRIYEICTDLPLQPEDVRRLAGGVQLRDGTCYRPARLVVSAADSRRGTVTVSEGKYHEVKNLLAVCGKTILSMQRVRLGALVLDPDLAPGKIRRLTPREVADVLPGADENCQIPDP